MNRKLLCLILANSILTLSCKEASTPQKTVKTTPTPVYAEIPQDPLLKSGREVWMETCKMCHEYGIEGAPKIGNYEEWKPRIAKGKEVLYDHAINGFSGVHIDMPPRGGNKDLTDEQVKHAVNYMIGLSNNNKEK